MNSYDNLGRESLSNEGVSGLTNSCQKIIQKDDSLKFKFIGVG